MAKRKGKEEVIPDKEEELPEEDNELDMEVSNEEAEVGVGHLGRKPKYEGKTAGGITVRHW